MFPRDRVMVSLKKYDIAFTEDESTEALRSKLAEFYARRTITRRPILPVDCANAIVFLAGDQSAKTTGHVIPVDGGLPEAFSTVNLGSIRAAACLKGNRRSGESQSSTTPIQTGLLSRVLLGFALELGI